MSLKAFAAYGSCLHLEAMKQRCPHAKAIGKAILPGWRLVWKGPQEQSALLTIEPEADARTELGIFLIDWQEEKLLDQYECYPELYSKSYVFVDVELFSGESVRMEVFFYRMDQSMPYNLPKPSDFEVYLASYFSFGLDPKQLQQALYVSDFEMGER